MNPTPRTPRNPSLTRRFAMQCAALGFASLAAPMVWARENPALDTNYTTFDGLLKKYVRWLPDNKQSKVDYKGLLSERAVLQKVLAEWSGVTAAQFAAMAREQRMVFLINAYNGFTLELILTRYPDLKSIKDLGSVFQSPWKNKFFTLLGEPRNLDWIEHDQLRPLYMDPRVHAAVNCASIGCPALRPEAFTTTKLESQLADGMSRFMGDKSRNRFNATSGKAEISSIFKWFREDFERGNLSFSKLEDVLAFYADQLTDDPASRDKLRAKSVPISFLDYDWSLNKQ